MTKAQYQTAWSLVRALHHYGRVDVYRDLFTLFESIPLTVRRAAARHFNQQRTHGVIYGGNGFDVMIWHCPDCGRMMLPGGVDDVSAPASVGPYGDTMCSVCASRAWRTEEEEWNDEIDYGFYDGIPW